MTKLELLKSKLDKNKGHSVRIHKGKSLAETGFNRRCYRCFLVVQIQGLEAGKRGRG